MSRGPGPCAGACLVSAVVIFVPSIWNRHVFIIDFDYLAPPAYPRAVPFAGSFPSTVSPFKELIGHLLLQALLINYVTAPGLLAH